MPSFVYLKEADLGPLATAAASWKALPAKYESLHDEFSRRVIKHLEGHWEGEAAEAAFATMAKARTQYKDAATEAGRIAKLLQDAHTEFSACQKQLKALVEEASADDFRISDKGVIEDVDSRWDSPTASAAPGFATERKEKLDSLESRINRVIELATAADAAASSALERDANGENDNSFNTSTYTSLDAVEADRASQLMKKEGRLSNSELTELNQLLSANRNDPEFARRFTTRTGAENTLEKYNELLSPPPGTQLSKKELAELEKFKRNLGVTIGTATTSDDKGSPDPAVTKFQEDLLAAGNRDFNANPTHSPYGLSGYQLTGSLMAEGKWDTGFLQDFGTEIITSEQRSARGGMNPDAHWGGHGTRALGSTNIGALDPMTGFMEALGHNPEAANKFLSSDSTVDGEKVDHLDYLMKDRHWPKGAGYTGHSEEGGGYDNLGHALEAATTGHAYDAPIPSPLPEHTRAQADLTSEIITKVSKEPELAHDGMQDSLGRMSAEYMPDINYALANKESKVDALYPMGDSERARISEQDATRFLYTVGQDPDGHAAINYGQTQYTSSLLEYHLQHPDAYDISAAEKVEKISTGGAEIEGIIGIARNDAVVNEKVADDKEFNDSLKAAGDWAKMGVGIGIGAGTAGIASPVGGAVVGGVAGTVSGQVIDAMVSGATRDKSGEVVYSAGGEAESRKNSYMAVTGDAAMRASQEAGADLSEAETGTAVSNGLDSGYVNAMSNLELYARDLGANPSP
ncbi:DUF6571 family protein [Streptomyces sp. NPDC059637]|uniref:DUF6571 family protein n=1 Tax=Streptomyces sp. NPDC059637 TaxID=3347752 RepID=UPI00367C567E